MELNRHATVIRGLSDDDDWRVAIIRPRSEPRLYDNVRYKWWKRLKSLTNTSPNFERIKVKIYSPWTYAIYATYGRWGKEPE